MTYQEAMSHVMNGLYRVTRPGWNDRDHPYPRMAYLVNASHLVRELDHWRPEDWLKIPEDLVLKIEDRAGLFDRSKYEPEPEDLVAEDWELFFPPENFSDYDVNHEFFFPNELWPEPEDDY